MALTATATRTSRRTICHVLGMANTLVIAQSPNRPNITYAVLAKPPTLKEAFTPLVAELRRSRTAIDRVIILGQSYDDCTDIFLFFRDKLGREMSDPVSIPQRARYRMVDLFTACTHPDVKDAILSLYQDPENCLRVVIATVAFGMGLDCPNVWRIIHWNVVCRTLLSSSHLRARYRPCAWICTRCPDNGTTVHGIHRRHTRGGWDSDSAVLEVFLADF